MSADFWLGLAALPVAAALIALLVFAVWALFALIWRSDYVRGHKRYRDGIPHRANIIRAIADMGHVHRIFYLYGWTMIVGRQPKPAPRGRRMPETNKKAPFIKALEEHYEATDD